MKVSVITPNYNGEKFLEDYFSSLNRDSECIGEVIIVDNGSDDSSIEFIENNSFEFPVVLIRNNENRGFAKAVNQGILKAKYDYVFLLNNDTEIEKGSIRPMLELFEEDIFSIQAKMLKADDRNLIDDAGDEYNLLGWTKKLGENQPSDSYGEVLEIFSSCAGAAVYRKDLLIELGLFDGEYFAYMEDVDLALRSQIRNYRSLMCPEAAVYHIGSATSGSRYNEFKVRIAARNNVWTIYKNFPTYLKIINFLFIFSGFLIKYIFFLKKGFGKHYLEGVREGLNTRFNVKKVDFKDTHYLRLEYKLIINTLKFLKK